MSEESTDPYVVHDASLRRIHGALLGLLGELADTEADTEVGVRRAIFAGRALLWHHRAESTILFPRLRSAGRARSDDVAFLDAFDRDHRDLHALCVRLLAVAESGGGAILDVRTIARDIAVQFGPHAVEEEARLAPAHLRRMISPEGLVVVAGEVEAARPR